MCTYLPVAVLMTFHLSISSIAGKVYLLRASKYISSEKRDFECAAFGQTEVLKAKSQSKKHDLSSVSLAAESFVHL